MFNVFYYFIKGFGLRGCHENRSMKLGDVTIKETTDSQRFLELREKNFKSMDGTKKNDMRETRPKLFVTGTEMCPVLLFQEFIDRRPASSIHPDSPMYLTPIPEQRIGDEVWYYRSPMGVNSLSKLVKKMCM